MVITKSLPINQIIKAPNDKKGAKGITCFNLIRFRDNPSKQYIAANIYEIPTANNVPKGPSQRASIATNFESPLPIASFLKIYLAKYLKDSKIKTMIGFIGSHVQALPIETLKKEKSIDLVFTNEGVYSLRNLLKKKI